MAERDPIADQPIVRTDFDPSPGTMNVVVPKPGFQGCAVLVPCPRPAGTNWARFYRIIAYVGADAGPSSMRLPSVEGIVLVDLPPCNAISYEGIACAIDQALGGGAGTGPDDSDRHRPRGPTPPPHPPPPGGPPTGVGI